MRAFNLITCLGALSTAGCLSSSDSLLCTADEDCAPDSRCEVVSGLCVPALQPPTFTEGGISGAFDCTLPTPMMAAPRAPGLASVVLRPPDADEACTGGPKGELQGLEVGCVVQRETQPRLRRGGEGPAFWVLRFDQSNGDPSGPLSRLAIYVRVEAAQVGEQSVPTQVTAQYLERCTRDDESQLRLRFVSSQGTMQFTEVSEQRIKGSFNMDLVGLSEGQGFGQVCRLPRPCEGGDCALIEQSTARCESGACFPDPREAQPTTGFCSGRCETHRDCGYDRDSNPDAFCLVEPGRPQGQCLQLCDPSGSNTCRTGATCRPGSDFDEFPGSLGPPRCLDECFSTASAPAPAGCAGAGTDAGVRPDSGGLDAGPRDTGPSPDSGAVDSGPADAGVTDTGPGPDAGITSPLGQACSSGVPCPTGWFCAQARAGPLGTQGYCSRPCGQPAQCTADYAGPGQVTCSPAVRNLETSMVVNPACMILCGADFGQNGQCPGTMSCGDIIDNMSRMPPGDGAADFCLE